jgi:hypothetical protein
MDKEIKAKWVAALRNGDYTQTQRELRNESGFCCLGVLCDLHSKETETEWSNNMYLGVQVHLPIKVKEWSKVSLINKIKVSINNNYDSLAEHNDAGKTFLEIADAIESQL